MTPAGIEPGALQRGLYLCNAVPQLTALPRALQFLYVNNKSLENLFYLQRSA